MKSTYPLLLVLFGGLAPLLGDQEVRSGGLVHSAGSLDDQGRTQAGMTTDVSHDYPNLTCKSTDPMVNEQVFYLAEKTRSDLTSLLKLGGDWRFPVHIRMVNVDDADAGMIDHPEIGIRAQNNLLNLYLILPVNHPQVREVLQREFVTECLWEKFFAKTTSFDANTSLDIVPFWLREGLREWLEEDDLQNRNREEIVLRAAQTHRAPTLRQVLSWHALSEDTLLGVWQRAFCYYLFKSMILTPERRSDFQAWLSTVTETDASPARKLFPTEMGWQRELLEADERSHDIVLTWEATKAKLEAAQAISFSEKTSDQTRVTTLAQLATFSAGPGLFRSVQAKLGELEEMEARAHPSWRAVIAEYRLGLTSLLNEKTAPQSGAILAQAEKDRAGELDRHAQLILYVNWYEVTKDTSGNHTEFPNYFYTAHLMEKAQADQPNPIRADLLQVEEKL